MPTETLFTIGDVTLSIPDEELNMPLRKALNSGRFEKSERRAVEMHLQPDDRVLELGSGSGLVTIQCARKVGSDRVVSVEPNPAMIPVIGGNLARNGIAPVTLHHGAVVGADADDTVTFFRHGGFWAGSLDQRNTPSETEVSVPAFPLSALIDRHSPSVLIADLEGAEEDVLPGQPLHDLRLVIVELHPKRYGSRGIDRIFTSLGQAGLTYQPDGSQGKVVVFSRIA